MLKHIACLFLYNFYVLGSHSEHDVSKEMTVVQITTPSASVVTTNTTSEEKASEKIARIVKEQTKLHLLRYYQTKEKALKEGQQAYRLSELVKVKTPVSEKVTFPTIEEMSLRIKLNQEEANRKIIMNALHILGLPLNLKHSWADIQAAYLMLNKDLKTDCSPAALDNAFLALRERKNQFTSS